MERFSEYLRTHRERKGIQLEEIASITKIHVRNLQLMESGQWHELPPPPFIRGFIIAYAKYVGIDGKEALERYYQENRPNTAASGTVEEDGSNPSPLAAEVIEQSRGIPFGAIGAGLALTLVFVVAGTLIYIGGRESATPVAVEAQTQTDMQRETAGETGTPAPNGAPETVKNVAADTAKSAVGTVAVAPPKPEVQRTPLPPGFDHEVSIALGKRSWVKVVVDNDKPKESVLAEGEKLTIVAKKKVKVVLANADGAKVAHNGVAAEGIAVRGTLRTYRFPTNAQFPQDMPPPPKPKVEPASIPEGDASAEAATPE